MTNSKDDSRDPSSPPWGNRRIWLWGFVLASISSGVIVYYHSDYYVAPKVLGRAPWEGEAISEINQAMPLLKEALIDANRVVVTMRKGGILFHTAGGFYARGRYRIKTYPPCRVHEASDSFAVPNLLSSLKLHDFGHTDRNDCDLVFHFYNDEKLLVVLGWIGGGGVIRGGKEDGNENYLRWFDGGWQGDVIPSWSRQDFLSWFKQNGMQFSHQLQLLQH